MIYAAYGWTFAVPLIVLTLAPVVMPCFLRGDSAAKRGRQIVGFPTVDLADG